MVTNLCSMAIMFMVKKTITQTEQLDVCHWLVTTNQFKVKVQGEEIQHGAAVRGDEMALGDAAAHGMQNGCDIQAAGDDGAV